MVLAVIVGASLAACGDDDGSSSSSSSSGSSGTPGQTIAALNLTPPTLSLAAGTTSKVTATATLLDNTTQNVTDTATWTTSAATIASVAKGTITALKPGSATLTAASGGLTKTITVTVTAATLASINVTPASPTLAIGVPKVLTATGTFSDKTTQDITASVTWSSSNAAIATVTAGGSASGVAAGTATIKATKGAISGTTQVTVSPAELVSIGVTPAAPTVAKGLTKQFTAMGVYSDATTQDLTATATWASSTPATATVVAGLATSLAEGTSTISATFNGIAGNTTLTVTAAALVSIAVTPANPTVPFGLTQQFKATGTYTDATTQDITAAVTWASSDATAATISNAAGSNGLATTAAVGSTTISAAMGAINGNTKLTVAAAALVSIAVTPADKSTALGVGQQYAATGSYTDATTKDLTTTVTWESSAITVATISNAAGSRGLASTVAVGTTTIKATMGGVSGSTGLTVTPAALVSIAVTPASPTIALSGTKQFVATGTFTDATTQVITTTVTWTSSATASATISNAAGSQGLATGTATAGKTTITATKSGVSGTTVLTVGSACYTAAKKVLVFGPLDSASSAVPFFPAGTTSTVVTAAAWSAMTTADFSAYDVLWAGGDCSASAATYSNIFTSQAAWGPAVTGRVLLVTADAAFHAPNGSPGAGVFQKNSVGYLGGLGHTSTGGSTGMYIAQGCSSVDYAPLATTFGSPLANGGGNGDINSLTAAGTASPIFAGLCISGCTDNLGWGSTSHGIFTSYPASMTNLASISSGVVAVAKQLSCY